MPRHKADMILAQQAATAAQNTSQNAKNLKKYYYALLKVANYAHTLSGGTDRSVYVHALSSKVNVLRKSKNKNCRGISSPKNILCTSETNHFKMTAIRAGAEAEAPIKERGQPTMKINTLKDDAYNNAKN